MKLMKPNSFKEREKIEANAKEYESSINSNIKLALAIIATSIAAGCINIPTAGTTITWFRFLGTLSIAILLLMTYNIILDKCGYRNRCYGYLNLLNQENLHASLHPRARRPVKIPDDIHAFDFCLSKLEEYKRSGVPRLPLAYCLDKLFFTMVKNGKKIDLWNNPHNRTEMEKLWEKYKICRPGADKNAFFKGLAQLCKLYHSGTSGSWKDPVVITIFFFLVAGMYMFVGLQIYFQQLKLNGLTSINMLLMTIFVSIMTVYILSFFFMGLKKLHSVMNGSSTIQAFCWKFLQPRVRFLNMLGIKPSYDSLDSSLQGG
jgi:hypothetical protein